MMFDPRRHRKRVRHFDEPGQAHELTFSCYHRLPLLTNKHWQRMLSEGIDRAAANHGFDLIAFVYMPEHVHLLVWPGQPTATVERLLYAIKRPVSFRIKRDLERTDQALLKRLTIRERPGKYSFRFWQEGPGYDRNILSSETARQTIDYIHNNPVRRGLCRSPGDWKWSSWRHYCGGSGYCDPDLPAIHGIPT